MSVTEYEEVTIDAIDLPDYVGWSLLGAMASDGTVLWGEILDARNIVHPVNGYPRVSVTYAHTVRNLGKVVTVPDGQLLSPDTPFGTHRVTIRRSR